MIETNGERESGKSVLAARHDDIYGPGDQGSIQDRVVPKIEKMVFNTSLLNTQEYKVRIKRKVEQSRERRSASPKHRSVDAIEKEAFGSSSPSVANFTHLFYILCS